MSNLVRFGVSIDEDLLHKFDQLNEGIYSNRSEAIRDLIRDRIVEEEWQDGEEKMTGSLTLIYDHHQRGLTEKMLQLQHDYHHLFKSNLHLHLDHDYCLEVIVVQGKAKELRQVSGMLIGLKGVKHGKLTLTSTGKDL